MLDITLAPQTIVIGVLIFVALMLALEGLYLLWKRYHSPEAVRLKKRIDALSANQEVDSGVLKQRLQREAPWVRRLLTTSAQARGVDRLLMQSGLDWSVTRFLGMAPLAYLLALVVALMALGVSLPASIVLGFIGPGSVYGFIAWKRGKRLAVLARQLPEALDLLTRALRAGHAFGSALKITADEIPMPMGGELRLVHDEINFGIPLDQALGHLADRIPSTVVRYFTVAVLVQRDAGGNLTEILVNLARLLRGRAKLMDKVRILSAEGRMSAWILAALPFGLALLLQLINPDFIGVLWSDPIGIAMVKVLLGMMAVGAVVMRRIVNIRV